MFSKMISTYQYMILAHHIMHENEKNLMSTPKMPDDAISKELEEVTNITQEEEKNDPTIKPISLPQSYVNICGAIPLSHCWLITKRAKNSNLFITTSILQSYSKSHK